MDDEEKKKLYDAIGYSEAGIPPEYPEEFEDIQLEFLLKQLVVIITDDENDGAAVTKAKLNTVTLNLKRRSAADAMRSGFSFSECCFVSHFSRELLSVLG